MFGKVQNTPQNVADFCRALKLVKIIWKSVHWLQFYSEKIPLQLLYQYFFGFIKPADLENTTSAKLTMTASQAKIDIVTM